MITSSAGLLSSNALSVLAYISYRGGISGCTVAARLAEDTTISVLLIEAGKHSKDIPASKLAGGFVNTC